MTLRLAHDWFPGVVPGNVSLGDGTWLHSSFAFRHYRSTRAEGLRAGRHCGFYIGTVFNLGPDAEMRVGDYSVLGSVIISTNGRIDIGSYALVSWDVVLAGRDFAVPAGDAATPDPPITIEDDAWIGARTIVLGGAHIGRGAIVGACSVVTGHVPDYSIVVGNPPRIVGHAPPRRTEGAAPEQRPKPA